MNKYLICLALILSIVACPVLAQEFTGRQTQVSLNIANPEKFIASFNNDDSIILTEDSYQNITAVDGNSNSNAGLLPNGTCRIDTTQLDSIVEVNQDSSLTVWVETDDSISVVERDTLGSPDWAKMIRIDENTADTRTKVESPTHATVTSQPGSIDITWNTVSDADSYTVYKRSDNRIVYEKVGTTTDNRLTDTDMRVNEQTGLVDPNETYRYIVVTNQDDVKTHTDEIAASPLEGPPAPTLEKIYIAEDGNVIESDTDLTLIGAYNDGSKQTLKTITFTVADKEDGSHNITENHESLTASATIHINRYSPDIKVNELDNNKVVAAKLDISALISDLSGIESVKVYVDGTEVKTQNSISTASVVKSYNVNHSVSAPLSTGTHDVTIVAADIYGKEETVNITGLQVMGSSVAFNYPNPCSTTTTLIYTLDNEADTRINIYDTTGRMVDCLVIPAGSEGAKAGVNRLEYNVENLANEAYHYLVIQDGVKAKGVMAVLR